VRERSLTQRIWVIQLPVVSSSSGAVSAAL
jgi:hypothetical protein